MQSIPPTTATKQTQAQICFFVVPVRGMGFIPERLLMMMIATRTSSPHTSSYIHMCESDYRSRQHSGTQPLFGVARLVL